MPSRLEKPGTSVSARAKASATAGCEASHVWIDVASDAADVRMCVNPAWKAFQKSDRENMHVYLSRSCRSHLRAYLCIGTKQIQCSQKKHNTNHDGDNIVDVTSNT